jgi:CRP-like cAMP-binding protein/glyoxylase-like metal-dependent hydrolase (beta-lactamase superfamily II)
MGCFPTKDEFLKDNQLDQLLNFVRNPEDSLINLQKGGFLIRTSAGYIQFGIPPETLKDSMNLGIPVPEYYIIPRDKFDWNDGISLMEFEFPVYYNFFLRKQNRTKIVCDKETAERIKVIFQETLLGPRAFQNFDQEFAKGYKGIPDMNRELKYFARNPFIPGTTFMFEQFVELHTFDSKSQVVIPVKNAERNIELRIVKKDNMFSIFEDTKLITSFYDEIKIKSTNYAVYKTIAFEDVSVFTPPTLGLTVLGSSHGFDHKGSTSGFIIWINKRGIMVDPPPYSSRVLRTQGIQPNLIEKIIITHCHADHDSGAFHKIIEASSVEFLSTSTILNSFLRKYSAISGLSVPEISKLFQYRTIEIGHPLLILGARFTFHYSFHSIPSLSFEVEFQGKWFYFSGDTFYNPPQLKELCDEGVLSLERYQSLAFRDLSKYDIIFHEAGIPPIHTPIQVLSDLPESVKEKTYLIHIAEKDIPPESKLKGVPVGLQKTLVLLSDEITGADPIISNLDLLCSIELINWVPFNRISEIITCFKEIRFANDDLIIKAGTVGEEFYVIKSGVVRIFLEDVDNSFSKFCYQGEYFGESAIMGNGLRLANVEACSDVTLLSINANDFKWIFNFQSRTVTERLGPLELIKNLSDMRKSKEAEFINMNSVVTKMTENQRCLINMLIKEVTLPKGSYFWKRSTSPNFCFFIKSGKVKVKAPHNKMAKYTIISPGTLIGDFPFLLGQGPCESTVKCLSDCVIFKFGAKDLQVFLGQYPGFFIAIKDKYVLP